MGESTEVILFIQQIGPDERWEQNVQNILDTLATLPWLVGPQEQLRQDRRADVLGDHQGVAEVEGRGLDGAAQQPQRVVEEVAIMVRAAAVGDDDRHSLLTTRPSSSLPVVGSPGWDVPHQGHVQDPDVDAHLQRGRGDQAVGLAVPGLEVLLDLVADLAGHLGGVLLGCDHHERSAHQPHVVVLSIGLLGDRRAMAVVAGAGRLR